MFQPLAGEGARAQGYPFVSEYQFHPCASGGTSCCGNKHGTVVARFTSYFSLASAKMLFTFESKPSCGDGLDVAIIHYRGGEAQVTSSLLSPTELATVLSRKPIPMLVLS